MRFEFYCPERPLFRGAVREKVYPVMRMMTGTLFSLFRRSGGGLEANSMKKGIEIVYDLLVEAI